MKLDKMVWMGKRNFSQKARKNNSCDISIRKTIGTDNNRTKARFTIRNGVSQLISETEYIQFSIPDTKHIYFMTGTKETGLKMTSQDKESENRYVQINKASDAEELIPFCGDYEIKFDQECQLYYIKK